MTTTAASQILIDDRGIAWLEGTNTKVIEVVLDKIAYGWSPEEIHLQHSHLPLAKIYAALAYYYEHQSELDKQIEADKRFVEILRAQAGESLVAKKLQAAGKTP